MRNTVLVTFDSLRADHCGFMGYDRPTTPTLDSMAADGLSFTNAISPGPSTPESMPVILTGEYPVEVESADGSLLASRRAIIRRHLRARDTLAERFSRAGYSTAAFTPNPYTSRYFGFDAGFDTFEDFMGGSRAKLYRGMLDGFLEGTSLTSVLPARMLLNWVQREEVFKPWTDFYEDVIEWTRTVDEPYFLWILLMDTHDPYLVPGEYRTQSRWAMYHANWRLWRQGHAPPFSQRTHDRLIRAYDDSIRFADEFLRRLQAELAADDPLIAVQGDHGEAFGEHGTYGHHARLYEENVHVPFVVAGAPDLDVESPVSLRETPDILLDLAIDGSMAPPSGPTDARTLDGNRIAARGRRWKYIRNGSEAEELYAIRRESDGEASLDDPSLRELGRALTDRWVQDRVERQLIADTAERLEEDGA